MKGKIFLLALALLFLLSGLYAQSDKVRFQSWNTGGIAIGKSGDAFIVQTVNGIQKDVWSAGVGFGIHNYYFKSFPLFADVRVYPFNKRTFYGFGDLGYNFPGKNEPKKTIYYESYHFDGGVYTGLGVGNIFKTGGKIKIVFEGGFSFKQIVTNIGTVSPCLTGQCPVSFSKYTYQLGTAVLRTGLLF